MRRITPFLAIGWLLVMATGGMWLAYQPPLQPLLPPDRIERQVGISGWEWRLSYHEQVPLDRWYYPLIQQLESGGWSRRNTGYVGRPLPLLDPVSYEHMASFGPVILWERVELSGDVHSRHLRIRRWITIQFFS